MSSAFPPDREAYLCFVDDIYWSDATLRPDCDNISGRILYRMSEIRTLRRTVGVTQAALADAAGTSQPTIAAYETGRKSPTLGTVRRLAESVGLAMSVQFHPLLDERGSP